EATVGLVPTQHLRIDRPIRQCRRVDTKPSAVETSGRRNLSNVVLRVRGRKPFPVCRSSGRLVLPGRNGETRGQRISVDYAKRHLGHQQRHRSGQCDSRQLKSRESACSSQTRERAITRALDSGEASGSSTRERYRTRPRALTWPDALRTKANTSYR